MRWFFVLLLLLLPRTVTAEEPAEEAADALDWRWRRHHPADYVATGVFAVGGLVAEVVPERDEPRLFGPVGFDAAFREAFVLDNFEDRRIAQRFSDVSLGALMTVPVVDAAVTWLAHDHGDTAWQMLAIDLQALAFSLALTNATKRAFERERPSVTACREDPDYDQRCREQGRDGSFFSGHTSLAFTAAGLTCVHRAHLPIFGFAGDVLACTSATFVATAVGFERVLADRHYISDVLVGSAVGVFSGAVMPYLSFYGWPLTLMPTGDGAGVGWGGAF